MHISSGSDSRDTWWNYYTRDGDGRKNIHGTYYLLLTTYYMTLPEATKRPKVHQSRHRNRHRLARAAPPSAHAICMKLIRCLCSYDCTRYYLVRRKATSPYCCRLILPDIHVPWPGKRGATRRDSSTKRGKR